MADYYTKASFVIEHETTQQRDAFLALALGLQAYADEETRHPQGDAVWRQVFGNNDPEDVDILSFEIEADDKTCTWIHHEESISIDAVCDLIAWAQQDTRYGIPDLVEFHWADDCSKARTDAYGGGMARIVKGKWACASTWDLDGVLNQRLTEQGAFS